MAVRIRSKTRVQAGASGRKSASKLENPAIPHITTPLSKENAARRGGILASIHHNIPPPAV